MIKDAARRSSDRVHNILKCSPVVPRMTCTFVFRTTITFSFSYEDPCTCPLLMSTSIIFRIPLCLLLLIVKTITSAPTSTMTLQHRASPCHWRDAEDGSFLSTREVPQSKEDCSVNSAFRRSSSTVWTRESIGNMLWEFRSCRDDTPSNG